MVLAAIAALIMGGDRQPLEIMLLAPLNSPEGLGSSIHGHAEKRAEAERKAVADAQKIVAIWNGRQAGGRELWATGPMRAR
jgi:hypothetical protein